MTRIASIKNNHPQVAQTNATQTIILTISGKPGKYHGRFDRDLIVTTEQKTNIRIELRNATESQATISILDYATTGVTATHKPIERFSIAPDKLSAEFYLSMLSNQLIDFGLSILVLTQTSTGMILEYLFCDPQASNDPKLGA